MSDTPIISSKPPSPNRRWLFGSAVAVGVLISVGVFAFQEIRLSRNLAKARGHLPVVRSMMENDSRFLGVVVAESPVSYGTLRVGGFVVSDADAEALRAAIDTTSPPVPLDWQLRVLGATAIAEAMMKSPPATAPASGPTDERR